MDAEGSADRGRESDGPFVFDEAWAAAGVRESAVRRRRSTPQRAPGGTNVMGAPAGPRDWSPPGSPSGRRRRRAWPVLVAFLIAAAVLVTALALNHHSGPISPPIAGGTIVATASPSAADNEPRVEGLTPATSVGSCFDLHGKIDIKATFTSCSQPHHLQLVGIETATGKNAQFPSDAYWNGPVERRCVADVVAYSHQPQRRWPPRLTELEFIPRRAGWATGDRTVYCAGRYRPRARGSLAELRPYLGRHAPIANGSIVRTGPSAVVPVTSTSSLSGKLGLVQSGGQVCLIVTTGDGSAAVQPVGDFSETWQIDDGRLDVARSGIATGTHPSAAHLRWHVGSSVTLTGSYASVPTQSCGQARQFDYIGVS